MATNDRADAIHEFCVENIERLAKERDAARAEVGVLREALTALLAAYEKAYYTDEGWQIFTELDAAVAAAREVLA